MSEAHNLDQLISQDTQLPTLPSGVPYLLQALASDTMTHRQIAEIITQFPSITARLLFLANSAWASPPVPIENLDMACARLGLTVVRSVSISLCVTSVFDPSHCKAFDIERFWCSNLLVADGAAMLIPYCPETTKLNNKTLHTAGLLHNIGLLWLCENFTEKTSKALQVALSDDSTSTISALRETVGTDYCEVGEALGNAWALPDILVTVMKQHRNPDYNSSYGQYAALIGCVAQMVSAIYQGVNECPVISGYPHLKLNPADFDDVFLKLTDKLDEYRKLTRLIFSG